MEWKYHLVLLEAILHGVLGGRESIFRRLELRRLSGIVHRLSCRFKRFLDIPKGAGKSDISVAKWINGNEVHTSRADAA